jgi:choice-of-anchor B domain-containing protein
MKNNYHYLLCLGFGLFSLATTAQIDQLTLTYNWDDPNIIGTSFYDNKYNEVWGFVQGGQEYAVIGSTEGVHFFNMDDLESGEIEAAFVQGTAVGGNLIHRDYHDYQGYLYTVADENQNASNVSTLQIIDLSGLPQSTQIVYQSSDLVERAHNIFIDTLSGTLYAMGVRANSTFYSLRIFSLANPEQPTLLTSLPNANLNLPYVHDGYIENGIGYFNCGGSGLYVVDFTEPENPVLLGTLTSYQDQGYNHSGWVHGTEPVYYLADENHGLRIKVVDVSDYTDMDVVNYFDAETDYPEESIPHNMIVLDDYLYVSYYFEGVQVYDISDAYNPVRVAEYDTYPIVDFTDDYNGNWGVYPFPGSKRIIASDMRNGLFVFEPYEPSTSTTNLSQDIQAKVYPMPFESTFHVRLDQAINNDIQCELYDLTGKLLHREVQSTGSFDIIPPNHLQAGSYLLRLDNDEINTTTKVIK